MKRAICSVVLGVCLAVGALPAFAQQTSQLPGDTDLDQMRARLDEAEQSYEYAQKAAQAGDLRGAIAALERVLQIDPTLDNVSLDLGLLYLRAGRPDLSSNYIERALASPAAPPDLRRRAEEALRMAKRESSPHSFYGTLVVGGQYDTNANSVPEALYVSGLGGNPILLNANALSAKADEDWSVVASFSGEYVYKLPQQSAPEIVVDGGVSTVTYDETTSLNSVAAQLRAGPRFYLGDITNPFASVRPYAKATHVALDGDQYYSGTGAGVDAELRQGLGLSLYSSLSWEKRDFSNSTARPNAGGESGDYAYASLGVSWRPTGSTTLRADGFVEVADTDATYQSRTRKGLRLSATQAIGVSKTSPAWQLRGSLGYQQSEYDQPDPFTGLGLARLDKRADAEIGLGIPLTSSVALDLRVGYANIDSNIVNYKYDNTFAAANVVWRF